MKKDDEYIYMVTDDTLDIGKEPLPRTKEEEKIFEEVKKKYNL